MIGFDSGPFSIFFINAFSPQFGGVISHERYAYERHECKFVSCRFFSCPVASRLCLRSKRSTNRPRLPRQLMHFLSHVVETKADVETKVVGFPTTI